MKVYGNMKIFLLGRVIIRTTAGPPREPLARIRESVSMRRRDDSDSCGIPYGCAFEVRPRRPTTAALEVPRITLD